MKQSVIIIGGGGHAKVLVQALLASAAPIAGIVDADPTMAGTVVLGIPVLGDDSHLEGLWAAEVRLVNGVGSVGLPEGRQAVFERFKSRGFSFAAVAHPSAVISSEVEIGEGAQVMAGAVIQPGCRIGCNSIVNTRASIDHDCVLGNHVHVAPGVTLSGGVTIGSGSHIGTGATVIQGIMIGERVTVAAGAVVVRDLPDGVTVKGVPAR